MSDHSLHQHTPKPPIGLGPDLIDLVPGEQPVPITVWRTAHSGDDQSTIPARLAYRLIAAYSRPGEAVIDLTDDHALTAMCLRGARRHHKAWFTDASALIIGPATPPAPATAAVTPAAADPRPDGDDELGEVADWFGDDLTDPNPPPTASAAVVPDDGSVRAATSLAVAGWPLDNGDATNRVRLAWLLTACGQMLRPGGCLVLVVGVPVGQAVTPEDFGPLVDAAAAAGLGYLQHIVAVGAAAEGERFIYHVSDEELLTLAHTSASRWAATHLRVHADLLVFSQPQFPVDRDACGKAHGGV